MARLAAATGVCVAGIAAALLLHEHHFSVAGNGFATRVPTLPPWRDPVAVVCAFGAIATAVVLAGRTRRVGLAVGVLGCAFAGAVYVHQQAVHTFVCPPGALCIPQSSPSLWSHPASLLLVVAGVATAVLLVLPHRWLRGQKLHDLRRR